MKIGATALLNSPTLLQPSDALGSKLITLHRGKCSPSRYYLSE